MVSGKLKQEDGFMTKNDHFIEYQDHFEYHGGTMIEHIRRQNNYVLRHDWILFDSVEEAREYFYEQI